MDKAHPIGEVASRNRNGRVTNPELAWMKNNGYVTDAPAPPTGGNCAGHPTQWWFVSPFNNQFMNERVSKEDRAQALALCRSCPIRESCLSYSVEWEPFGVWGAFDEAQRDAIREYWGVTLKRTARPRMRYGAGVSVWSFIADEDDQAFLKALTAKRKGK